MASIPEHSPPALEAVELTKVYPDGQVTALDHVSLRVPTGEYLAIMGPSGSGKSTLLQLLGALDRPTSGEVLIHGRPLSQERSLDRIRAAEIGFVFQSFHLLPTLTALENVQIPMFEGPLRPPERTARARQWLERVGISHRARHVPARLSVGERQRVAVARALANHPSILLADEPTGNLDSQTGQQMLALFDQLHQEEHMTLVVITHDIEVARRAQRLIRLRDGRLESDQRGNTLS
jgi:ABC-type lipoprotein export system ATPase subunit